MVEQDRFEARLHAALSRYAADATTRLDAAAFAHAVVTAEPRRRSALSWLQLPEIRIGRLAWLLLIAALLTALTAAALLSGAGSRPMGWQRLEIPGEGRFTDVSAGPGGYVAAGSDNSGGMAFWTSRDCSRWTAAKVEDATADRIVTLAAGGPGYVAVGQTTGFVWTSSDGKAWKHAASLPFGGGTYDAAISDIAVRGDRFVAVGLISGNGGPEQAIWTSPDGTQWSRVIPLEGAGPAYGIATLSAVVATESGFVAVGSSLAQPIWTSTDGISWTLSPQTQSTGGDASWARLTAVFSRDGTLTAFGTRGPDGFRAWRSTNGRTWTSEATTGLFATGQTFVSIANTPRGFVGVSTVDASPLPVPSGIPGQVLYPHLGQLWTSKDGLAWQTATPPTDERSSLESVFACGPQLLVAGVLGVDPPAGILGWVEKPSVWLLPDGARP